MYDFIGRIKKMRSTGRRNIFAVIAEDGCDETGNGNWAVFNVDGKLLSDAEVRDGDWVKIRFSLKGRESGREKSLFLDAVCTQIKVLVHAKKEETPAEAQTQGDVDSVDDPDSPF